MELVESGNNAATLVGPKVNVGTAQNWGKIFFIPKIVQFQWRKQLWQSLENGFFCGVSNYGRVWRMGPSVA